jgi:tetratricopeptide (TPR) repeat protein
MNRVCLFPRLAQSFLLAALICTLFLPAELPGQAEPSEYQQYWDRVYKENHVLQIDLTLTRADWDTLNNSVQRLRPGQDSQYRPATMVIDGEKLEQVGFRFKGNSSLRSSGLSPRKPFKIDTNRFVEGQQVGGCSKLNLSNVFADPTYLREKIGYEIFQAAGLPTPGVGWARLTLSIDGLYDKESLGLYVVIEQVNDDLLERQLGADSKNSLLMKPERFADWQYLGDDPASYEIYDIKEGRKKEELIVRFANVLRLIQEADDEEFAARAGELLDLDNFASYLAANCLIVNLDSFVAAPHNYYLLMDEADGKLKILPWDLNMCFGIFSLFRTGDDLATWTVKQPWVMDRKVIVRLFELEAFREKYFAAVNELRETVFTEQSLFARIDELNKVLQPELEQLHGEAGPLAQQAGLEGGTPGAALQVRGPRAPALKPFIVDRITSITAQLAGQEDGLVLQRAERAQQAPIQLTPQQQMWAAVTAAEQAGEYDKGIESLNKIMQAAGAKSDGYINLRLGWLHYLKQDYPASIQYYSASAAALPGALPPRQGLMACYQAVGDSDRLVEAAQGIVALNPTNYAANKTLADTFYAGRDYDSAASYYLQLATANPNDLAMVTNLGWCYLQSGRLELAAQVLNNVITVSPQDASTRQALDRLSALRRVQAREQAVMQRLMAVLDSDQDGELSAEELTAAAARLEQLDANKDGTISLRELDPPPGPQR